MYKTGLYNDLYKKPQKQEKDKKRQVLRKCFIRPFYEI